jgi:universal stress protein A
MPATKSKTRSSATSSKRLSTPPKAHPSTSSQPAGLKRTPSFKLRTILVPVDFSERSRAALNYAITLARDFGGSLVVLHVLDPLLAAGRLESARLRQLKTSSRSEADEQLQALGRELAPSGVRTRLFLRHGPATNIIVAFAVVKKADLIIMGSQGRTGLSRLLIGSVAEQVVRHAPCPVLVVR